MKHSESVSRFMAVLIAVIFAVFMTFVMAFLPVAEAEEMDFDDFGDSVPQTAINLTSIVDLLTGDVLVIIILIVVIGAIVGMFKRLGGNL